MNESNTLILRTATLFLMPLQLLFSVFLLLRGHDEPGGGFIAGLVASGAVVLFLFSYGVREARSLLRVDPRDFLAAGLLFRARVCFSCIARRRTADDRPVVVYPHARRWDAQALDTTDF